MHVLYICQSCIGMLTLEEETIHFVPMFLHTSFGPDGKCLLEVSLFLQTDIHQRQKTFAISLQLLPASLISFNLCSSAGVHGVLVLFFLGAGGFIIRSISDGPPAKTSWSRKEVEVADAGWFIAVESEMSEMVRLRLVLGDNCICWCWCGGGWDSGTANGKYGSECCTNCCCCILGRLCIMAWEWETSEGMEIGNGGRVAEGR